MTRDGAWILKAKQQRTLDELSVSVGTSAEKLMESAGTHAAEWILSHLQPDSAVVLAGPGGNGGDAFVVARYLLQAGILVHVFSLRELDLCSSLTRTMADRLMRIGAKIHVLGTERSLLDRAMDDANCVIDGLFGSGLSRPPSGEFAEIISILNDSNVPIVSLDLPSGLPSDSGNVLGAAIRATVTLAMAFHKPSHWLYPAAEYCGAVHIVDVDYPEEPLCRLSPTARVHDMEAVRGMLPSRKPLGHKGTFGRVLVVAGSQRMTGAAILCARGALRAGAGLVTLALPETIAPVIQAAVPEAITLPLPDRAGRLVNFPELLKSLEPVMEGADVMAIGPGLSRELETMDLIRRIIGAFSGKLVIDADAIHALVGHSDLLDELDGRAVLTPHPGEFAALIGSTPRDVDANRLDRVEEFISQQSLALVLKGRPTIIGLPDQSLVVNPTGNTGLATGGSGDVLTGLLAGLIAGGSSVEDAAVAAPFIHGLAADRWADAFSERSLTPSDVLDALPRLLKELET